MPASSTRVARLGILTAAILGAATWTSAAPPAPPQAARSDYARQLWDQGQAAMRVGQVKAAIDFYQQSLAADPGMVRNHLSLAAAYLEAGEPESSCVHLASYLHYYPEHVVVRVHYAELLLRLERLTEAREQYERFADDCPGRDGNDLKQLIHCHSRLMEIAEAVDDEYGRRLHRGIGLLLLAKERAAAGDWGDDQPPEALLCKAAAELTQARLERPDQARPSWYLYQVWSKLGRRQPALRSLREADEAAPFSELSPAEQTALAMARQREGDHEIRK